ncbi:MAG: hypothetical protein V3S55_14270 [Nitrospiraceae bacterium]
MKLLLYLTWKELLGKRPTEQEVIQDIQKFDRLHTVLLLSRIGIHLFLDNFHSEAKEANALQRFLVANFFNDEVLAKAKEKYGRDRLDVRRAFHCQQVLTLLKWGILHGASINGLRPDTDRKARFELGDCLLKTSDLLYTKEMRKVMKSWLRVPTMNKFVAFQLQAGSAFEVNNPPPINMSIVRNDMIFGEILRNVPTSIDVATEFSKCTGLDLDVYIDMILGILAHYLSKSQQQLIDDPGLSLINPKTFFGIASAKQAEKFWALESATMDEMAQELGKDTGLKPHQDSNVFRMKPFIRINEEAVLCLNPGFVQEKLEVGLFWSIVNHLGDGDRKKMFDTWGGLFESYVTDLLGTFIRSDSEAYVPFPEFSEKGHRHESFDALIVSGAKCIVIECKGGFLTSRAKYSEDREGFLEDLDLKFGAQPGGGVEQLVRKIGQVFARKESERRKMESLSPEEIEIVVPVLVVQDAFVASPFTAAWLAKRFRDSMRKKDVLKKLKWMGLVVIDVGELEAIRPYIMSGKVVFSDCVMYRARKGDPGSDNRVFSFGDVMESFFEEMKIEQVPPSECDDRFEVIINRVTMRFFGQPFKRVGQARGKLG